MVLYALVATLVIGPLVAVQVEKKRSLRRQKEERQLHAFKTRLQAVNATLVRDQKLGCE